MTCPFCNRTLVREEIEMWEAFACPWCHKWLRVRRNFTLRIFRLGLVGCVLFYLLSRVESWSKAHFGSELVMIAVAAIGVIDEYLMRMFRVRIEPAAPGGLAI